MIPELVVCRRHFGMIAAACEARGLPTGVPFTEPPSPSLACEVLITLADSARTFVDPRIRGCSLCATCAESEADARSMIDAALAFATHLARELGLVPKLN